MSRRIRQYEAATGEAVTIPMTIEEAVERVSGPGEENVGGLHVECRRLYLNSWHLALFESDPGAGAGHDPPRGRLDAGTLSRLLGGGESGDDRAGRVPLVRPATPD